MRRSPPHPDVKLPCRTRPTLSISRTFLPDLGRNALCAFTAFKDVVVDVTDRTVKMTDNAASLFNAPCRAHCARTFPRSERPMRRDNPYQLTRYQHANA